MSNLLDRDTVINYLWRNYVEKREALEMHDRAQRDRIAQLESYLSNAWDAIDSGDSPWERAYTILEEANGLLTKP